MTKVKMAKGTIIDKMESKEKIQEIIEIILLGVSRLLYTWQRSSGTRMKTGKVLHDFCSTIHLNYPHSESSKFASTVSKNTTTI